MAENSILTLTKGCNGSELLIDGEINGLPAILSTKIADRFNKKHQHILRNIDTLQSILPESFTASNFGLSKYYDSTGRQLRAYLLTRDAFSLLVMGMTGKAAIIWKLRYIEAFNALERAVLENRAELAREAGYMQGKEEALALPIMEAERKKAFLTGFTEGKKLAKRDDRLLALEKIARYIAKGLSYSEIGKILGLSRSCVAKRVERARKTGFWPQKCGTLAQTTLPGVAL